MKIIPTRSIVIGVAACLGGALLSCSDNKGPYDHLSLKTFDTLSINECRISQDEVRHELLCLCRADNDTTPTDSKTRHFYRNGGELLWVDRMGVDPRVDTLLSHLGNVGNFGFTAKSFYVQLIADDLKRVRTLDFDDSKNSISKVLARMEYRLTKAYLRYVAGQRYGYVSPYMAFNSLDLIDTTAVDFTVTNYISIAAIFLIIAIVFQSVTIPAVLVATIELAIFINQGCCYFTGTAIPFIAPTIISCVQLGATVDYAILMTSRFQEELRKGRPRMEAIRVAADAADASIVTSALVLFCATLGVSFVSSIDLIGSICVMLARGALISALVSLFLMPAILCVCEPVFNKTSRHWRTTPPPRRGKALPAGEAQPAETSAQPSVRQ